MFGLLTHGSIVDWLGGAECAPLAGANAASSLPQSQDVAVVSGSYAASEIRCGFSRPGFRVRAPPTSLATRSPNDRRTRAASHTPVAITTADERAVVGR